MDHQQATVGELAWLAGIIDGEGNLDLNKRYGLKYKNAYGEYTSHWNRPRIIIGNTDARMISKVSFIYDKLGNKFWYHIVKRKNKNHKPCLWVITIGIRNVAKVLDAVYPWLTTKKSQAEILMDYCEWRTRSFGDTGKGIPKSEQSRSHELVPEYTQLVQDAKQALPDVLHLSRKANIPLEISMESSEAMSRALLKLKEKRRYGPTLSES